MRIFTGIPAQVLKRQPQKRSVDLLNQAAQAPTAIVVSVDWSEYGAGTANPEVNVLINAQTQGALPSIDWVRSVRIDNLGNAAQVYVTFPDTGFTVACPPFAVVWEPVVTNARICNIVGTGFSDQGVGETQVFITNIIVSPFIDPEVVQNIELWKGTPTSPRADRLAQLNYSAPALGDQLLEVGVDISAGAPVLPAFFPIAAWAEDDDFLYITGFNLQVNLFIVTFAAPGAGQWALFRGAFRKSDNSETLWRFRVGASIVNATDTIASVQVASAARVGPMNFRRSMTLTNYGIEYSSFTSVGAVADWRLNMSNHISFTRNPS